MFFYQDINKVSIRFTKVRIDIMNFLSPNTERINRYSVCSNRIEILGYKTLFGVGDGVVGKKKNAKVNKLVLAHINNE